MSVERGDDEPRGVEGLLLPFRSHRGRLSKVEVWLHDRYGLGAEHGPELGRALSDPFAPVRCAAAEAIGMLGAVGGAPALVGALRGDVKVHVRRRAAWALGMLGPEARRAVPALLRALRERDEVLRRRAIEALGRIRASDAVPALLALLDDRSPALRFEAMLALRGIADPAAAPTLADHLPYEDALQATLLSAIGACADRLPDVELGVASSRASWEERGALFLVLGELRPHAAQSAPWLLRGLSAAQEAWFAVAGLRDQVELLRTIYHREQELQACILALGRLGSASVAALRPLEALAERTRHDEYALWTSVLCAAAIDDIRRDALLPPSGADAASLPIAPGVARPRLALAAALGHGGARRALGAPLDDPPDLRTAAEACAGDEILRVRFGIALARPAIVRWEREIQGSHAMRAAVASAEAWLRDPTPSHREAFVRCDLGITQGNSTETMYGGWSVQAALRLDGDRRMADAVSYALGAGKEVPHRWGLQAVPPHGGRVAAQRLLPPLPRVTPVELLEAVQREVIPWAVGAGDPVRDRAPWPAATPNPTAR